MTRSDYLEAGPKLGIWMTPVIQVIREMIHFSSVFLRKGVREAREGWEEGRKG
jgi:hypothetical protein